MTDMTIEQVCAEFGTAVLLAPQKTGGPYVVFSGPKDISDLIGTIGQDKVERLEQVEFTEDEQARFRRHKSLEWLVGYGSEIAIDLNIEHSFGEGDEARCMRHIVIYAKVK